MTPEDIEMNTPYGPRGESRRSYVPCYCPRCVAYYRLPRQERIKNREQLRWWLVVPVVIMGTAGFIITMVFLARYKKP
ncbi:hypothetical protein B0T11DRAFT_325238 [Plectosphaerella cucumerina]|uniref:Uncharacterized protein n=1 Tax=Plectosphaerella cucumerina TaxID=40658 RepID=A0A8K0TJV9_9PEZI|nr:hypothetical protein B0T11DRAFT_325238 [Plectosphaerella cucumerina]